MKTNNKNPDTDDRPAKADASAGQKKIKHLTPEEIQCQRLRFIDTPGFEKMNALVKAAKYATKRLQRYDPETRKAFSEEELGDDPLRVISQRCIDDIYDGKRKWPENVNLETMLIMTTRSVMSHTANSYLKRKQHTSSIDAHPALGKQVEAAVAAAEEELENEKCLRGVVIKEAIKAVQNNESFLRYLEALQEKNNYEAIAESLDLELQDVLIVEKRLLRYLRKYFHRK